MADGDGRMVDVVVIGGGPAGSTVSTLIARQGYRVELFERERFPRFHIGESLIPETYWVLKRLDMLPKMQASHFVRKYSVQFVNASGKLSAPFYFWDNKPHECSQTWQVARSEFDQMLLENAREHGAIAHEGVRVVAPFDYLFKNPSSYEQTYQEEVERCAAARERVSIGRRATGYFATKDYSYRATRVAGDGWVMVGDAWGFLDPLYSSGVLLALKSGELAAEAIVEGLKSGDTSAAQLGKWGPDFNKGVDRMRRLVCEYYDGFSFGQFVRHNPGLQGTITDLLIGDLFTDRVDTVWQPMEAMYPSGKAPIPPWNAGAPLDAAPEKANELVLPEGRKP